MRFISPGKTKYTTQTSVKRELVSNNLSDCLYDKSTSSEVQKTADDCSEYEPSSDEEKGKSSMENNFRGNLKVLRGLKKSSGECLLASLLK